MLRIRVTRPALCLELLVSGVTVEFNFGFPKVGLPFVVFPVLRTFGGIFRVLFTEKDPKHPKVLKNSEPKRQGSQLLPTTAASRKHRTLS